MENNKRNIWMFDSGWKWERGTTIPFLSLQENTYIEKNQATVNVLPPSSIYF